MKNSKKLSKNAILAQLTLLFVIIVLNSVSLQAETDSLQAVEPKTQNSITIWNKTPLKARACLESYVEHDIDKQFGKVSGCFDMKGYETIHTGIKPRQTTNLSLSWTTTPPTTIINPKNAPERHNNKNKRIYYSWEHHVLPSPTSNNPNKKTSFGKIAINNGHQSNSYFINNKVVDEANYEKLLATSKNILHNQIDPFELLYLVEQYKSDPSLIPHLTGHDLLIIGEKKEQDLFTSNSFDSMATVNNPNMSNTSVSNTSVSSNDHTSHNISNTGSSDSLLSPLSPSLVTLETPTQSSMDIDYVDPENLTIQLGSLATMTSALTYIATQKSQESLLESDSPNTSQETLTSIASKPQQPTTPTVTPATKPSQPTLSTITTAPTLTATPTPPATSSPGIRRPAPVLIPIPEEETPASAIIMPLPPITAPPRRRSMTKSATFPVSTDTPQESNMSGQAQKDTPVSSHPQSRSTTYLPGTNGHIKPYKSPKLPTIPNNVLNKKIQETRSSRTKSLEETSLPPITPKPTHSSLPSLSTSPGSTSSLGSSDQSEVSGSSEPLSSAQSTTSIYSNDSLEPGILDESPNLPRSPDGTSNKRKDISPRTRKLLKSNEDI